MLIRPGRVGGFAYGRRSETRTLKDLLPSGAIGVWDAADYQSSPRPYVPNLVTPNAAAPKNLLQSPRGQFGNSLRYGGSSRTVTTGQTDYQGGTQAARVNGTGNWDYTYAHSVTFPAGTYTIAGRYKSNTGSDVPFRMGISGAGGAFANKTATTSWQRLTYTLTITGGSGSVMFARSIDGATDGDILVDELEVFPGAADLGPETPSGHLLTGRNAYDTNTSHDGASFGPLLTGEVQFANSISFSAYTVIAVASRTTNIKTHNGIMARLGTGTGNFNATFGENDAVSPPAGSSYSTQPIYKPYQDGWRMFTHTGDATNQQFWLDDAMFLQSAGGMTAFTLKDLIFGITSNYTFLNDYRVAAWVLYNRKLSEAEIIAAYETLQVHVAQSSIILPTNILQIGTADGDSISQQANNFLIQSKTLVADLRYLTSFAVAGSVLADVNGRTARSDATLRTARVGGHNAIHSLYIFVNGLASYAGATNQDKANAAFADLVAYHAARKANAPGVKTIACTVGPISGSTTHNAVRALLNPMIIAGEGTHWDAVADFGGNATMGPDDSYTNPLTSGNWTDGTHPNAAGSLKLATEEWAPAVDSLTP